MRALTSFYVLTTSAAIIAIWVSAAQRSTLASANKVEGEPLRARICRNIFDDTGDLCAEAQFVTHPRWHTETRISVPDGSCGWVDETVAIPPLPDAVSAYSPDGRIRYRIYDDGWIISERVDAAELVGEIAFADAPTLSEY